MSPYDVSLRKVRQFTVNSRATSAGAESQSRGLSKVIIGFVCVVAVMTNATMAKSESASDEESIGGLKWIDLGVSMHRNPHQSKDKYLLFPSDGFIPNGSLCGVIGPSGSGKSTLLSAIGGVTSKTAGVHVTGSVWLEEYERGKFEDEHPMKKSFLSTKDGEVALLQQEDSFFSMLTTRETINLAAFLQLPPSKAKERPRAVNRILESLGLKEHEHRRIGDRLVGGQSRGGLSGGERRRLSVAVELVTTPKLFLADEATTGLDSTQAEKVVELMRKLCKEREIPCVCTLHQPRASIWRKLDQIILLAPGGKICFMGDRTAASAYFETLGYQCPSETNPAEFMIDLVSVDTEDITQAAIDLKRIEYLALSFTQNCTGSRTDSLSWMPPKPQNGLRIMDNLPRKKKKLRVNAFRRFVALFMRAWRQNIRDMNLNLFRLAASIGQAFLFSQIFSSVAPGPPTATSVADRTALLSFGAVNMSMLSVMKTLTLFGKEKSVVTRERMREQYTGAEYLLSKVLAEFPLDAAFSAAFAAMLKWMTGLRCSMAVLCGTYSLMTVAGASLGFAIGSLTSSSDSAMTAGMPVMVILMIWLKLASPIKWAIEALCVAEYRGMRFETRKGFFRRLLDTPRMGAYALVQNGDQVLDALALSYVSYEDTMKGLATVVGANLFVSLIGLTFLGPSYVQATGAQREEPISENGDRIPSEKFRSEVERPRSSTSAKNKHNRLLNAPTTRGI